jgi:mono/diheme cytochrome c family protein
MSSKNRSKSSTGLATLAAAVLVGSLVISPRFASAQSWSKLDEQTAQRIAVGYAATPVGVDLKGKDPLQVGLGSYIVNATGVCNHCHSANQYQKAGFPLTTSNFSAQTGNPYFLPPPNGPYAYAGEWRPDGGAVFKIDPTTFVAGGQNFGAVDSKNLTPSPNASPSWFAPYAVNYAEGGIDWITYWAVLHNGVDIDQLFSQCGSGAPPGPNGCASAPTNAALLQVMPWPTVRQLTDSDLNAVWQYLSAIPCNTNLSNVNGPSGTNIANTYGGGVLINGCSPAGTYEFYELVNRQVVRKSAGLTGSASLIEIAPLPDEAENAQQGKNAGWGIQTPAGLSTPSCGLGIKPYPSCPLSADDERIAEGFRINPVPLNLTGLDPRKVGIGSYWVNSAGNCDGCHGGTNGGQFTAGGNPANLPVALGGNYTGDYHSTTAIPYNPTATENPVSFLAGGVNFGNGACDASGMGGCGAPDIIVRNLTPDWSTGHPLPEKNTLEHFKETLRTGHDFQQVHPNCAPLGSGVEPNCVTAPSDGSKLQIMPWPALGVATDYDLESIYAYLSAIPCISNAGSPYPQIVNVCPAHPWAGYHKYEYVKGQAVRLD